MSSFGLSHVLSNNNPAGGGAAGGGPVESTGVEEKWQWFAPRPKVPDNWIKISPDTVQPPGIYAFLTFKDDMIHVAVKRLQYEKNADMSYKLTPDGAMGYVKPTWKDSLEMNLDECANLYKILPDLTAKTGTFLGPPSGGEHSDN